MHQLLPIITFPQFPAPHAFTTRWFSYNAKKTSFDLSTKALDDGTHFAWYKLNYLKKNLEIPQHQIFSPTQCHSITIVDVTEANVYETPMADGAITQLNGVALAIKVADCAAVYLYDPNTKTIGLIHCGWRGTKDDFIIEAISMMQTTYKCRPEDIYAAISPHISQEFYQVGYEFSFYFSDDFFTINETGRYLNLQKCLVHQLLSCNVPESNIQQNHLCTYKQDDLFFSYRRDNTKERMMALIWLP